jgi:signal transduction histidine kinase
MHSEFRTTAPHMTPKSAPPEAPTLRWVDALLRIPLVGKIAGANAIIVVAALGVAFAFGVDAPDSSRLMAILTVALAGSLLVNVALVLLALRPLEDLERTAFAIWSGDMQARVPSSRLADADMQRIGGAINELLDGLTADRAHMRALASQVISAGDAERASLARELHDSTAQTLAAVMLEMSVAVNENRDQSLQPRLERVKAIAADVLDEVKLLAHTVHPRVLDDLGLEAALEHLAREAMVRSQVPVLVSVEALAEPLSKGVTSVLYRVAQEAVNNALKHAVPRTISIHVNVQAGVAHLEVRDDGSGFDAKDAERRRPGMGLFTMRERAALVGGALEILSRPGAGTRVVATVPLSVTGRPLESQTRGGFPNENAPSGAERAKR